MLAERTLTPHLASARRGVFSICVLIQSMAYVPTSDGGSKLVDPAGCPNGHTWRPKRSFRRHYLPCACTDTGGHLGWECQTCPAEIWEPPLCDRQRIGTGDYFGG